MDAVPAVTVILWASRVPPLAAFLETVAGFEIVAQHPGFAALARDGARVEIHGDEAYRGHPWYDALHREGAARGIGAELRVRVEDVAAAYRRALSLGSSAVYAPYEAQEYEECQVLAPDGYMLSLWRPLDR